MPFCAPQRQPGVMSNEVLVSTEGDGGDAVSHIAPAHLRQSMQSDDEE